MCSNYLGCIILILLLHISLTTANSFLWWSPFLFPKTIGSITCSVFFRKWWSTTNQLVQAYRELLWWLHPAMTVPSVRTQTQFHANPASELCALPLKAECNGGTIEDFHPVAPDAILIGQCNPTSCPDCMRRILDTVHQLIRNVRNM